MNGMSDDAYREFVSRLNRLRLADVELDLSRASKLHHADLVKTQVSFQHYLPHNASILVFVKYPQSASITSCKYSSFLPGRVRLTRAQLEGTGSEMLMGLLDNEKYQQRARRAASPLEDGVTHVLDLSPSFDEEDVTVALQRLSITEGIKLWHRSMAFGVSPLAVAAHDDVCSCLYGAHEAYTLPVPPETADITGLGGEICIFDTKKWPVEKHYDIPDFCQTRWAACTQRLFRSIALPAGRKDLLIDSAPRMWTLVGLFSKLEMTNYDLLRDEVTAWFNADLNYLFVEIFPEESLRVGLALKSPLLSEPAFRILVNERALEVAGGQPRSQQNRTIFGRRCSDFTDDTESISRMIDHAGTAMADRYKLALDKISSENVLDELSVPKWSELLLLGHIIPKESSTGVTPKVRVFYDEMMAAARAAVHKTIHRVFEDGIVRLVDMKTTTPFLGVGWETSPPSSLNSDVIDAKRSYTVPKHELQHSQSFTRIWEMSLNRHQRALTSLFWQSVRHVKAEQMSTFFSAAGTAATDFALELDRAVRRGDLPPHEAHSLAPAGVPAHFGRLFAGAERALHELAASLVGRDPDTFVYAATPHLVLALDDNEMNFLRLADDETRFQAEVPEAAAGPIGPGPAFHTGLSVASTASSTGDFDFVGRRGRHVSGDDDIDDGFAFGYDDDGASTVVGSLVAQDGVSTVYDRRRVLVGAPGGSVASTASERFTDDDGLDAVYADAASAVPGAHRLRGQGLADIVEEETSNDCGAFGLSDDDMMDDGDDLSFMDEGSEDEGVCSDDDDGEEKKSDDDDFEVVSVPDCG